MKSDAVIGAVEGVTKRWAKQRKKEERDESARANRQYVMMRRRDVTIREAAWQIMQDAYMKASANDTLPAHARQIMYAARGHIQRTADRPLGKNFDQYFTQQLLPDYMEKTGVTWNVVFDARGHFHEPHTEEEVPLGTLQVRRYLQRIRRHSIDELSFNIREKHFPTLGPKNRYGAILFIEKEGFMPLFEEVQLAERYDIAIMSTKGMSVTASRQLVDDLCAQNNIPLLVLHDFDKAGFSIAGTLRRDTRRYQFQHAINVVDLGMRIEDIDGLETEDVHLQAVGAARQNLRDNGATDDEIKFLLHQRVELNAFPSDELVAWIEQKLDEQGVKKIIPDEELLTEAYQRALRQALVQQRIDALIEEMQSDEDFQVPSDLADQVADQLQETPSRTWDGVVQDLAEDAAGKDGEAA